MHQLPNLVRRSMVGGVLLRPYYPSPRPCPRARVPTTDPRVRKWFARHRVLRRRRRRRNELRSASRVAHCCCLCARARAYCQQVVSVTRHTPRAAAVHLPALARAIRVRFFARRRRSAPSSLRFLSEKRRNSRTRRKSVFRVR